MSNVNFGAEIRSGKRPLKAAVLQLHGAHDEIMPGLFHVLEANGVEPTGYLSDRIERRGDIFAPYTPYGDRVHYGDFTPKSGELPKLQEELADYDLVVLNTMAYSTPAVLAKRSGLPTIGIVHNPKMVLANKDSVDLIRSGQATCATLAPHATSWMMSQQPQLFSKTVTLGAWMWPMPDVDHQPTQRRRITVPGAVDFNKRDFPSLLDLLPDLVKEYGEDAFEISVVGGGRERLTLESMVRERGLTNVFDFAPFDAATGMVMTEDYYPQLARTDLLLPMLPERQASFRVHKISASLSTSIGFGLPAVLDRWTASVYGVPACTYPLGRLDEGLRKALSVTRAEIDDMRRGLDTYRTEMIDRSIGELNIALTEIGSPPIPLGPDTIGADPEDEAASSGTSVELPRAEPVTLRVRRDDKEAFLAFAEAVLPCSYSQRLQDLWALWESGFRMEGYFAEFGALSGRDFSNTYLMEQLGWTGVIAEPHPRYADLMPANRTCGISTKCVFDTTGDTVEFHVVKGRPALSTVAGFGQDDDRSAVRENYETHYVETITLEDLLRESDAPDVIDYLSIDTEGSELVILGAYDFTQRPIRMISVEHNNTHRDELFDMLTAHGYVRRWPELSGHDDWYVLDGAYPDWSPSAMSNFVSVVDTIKPFVRDLPLRTSLVGSLRTRVGPPRELLGLPAGPPPPVVPSAVSQSDRALAASYAFNKRFYERLAARTGLTDQQLNQRVSEMFIRLCTRLAPTVVLEIGAFEASFSRRMRAALPDARVIAYEANPFVYEHFRAEVEAAGVDYRHQAAARGSGTLHFRVPKDYRGTERQKINQLSSLKTNLATEAYHDVKVESVSIDEVFPDPLSDTFVVWIDVEGACEEVLLGAEKTLARAQAIYVEVEGRAIWDEQWLDVDVANFLMQRGFVLIARDKLKPGQFNLVFVHHSIARRPKVSQLAAQIYPLNRGRIRANKANGSGGSPRTQQTPSPMARAEDLVRRVARKARSVARRS